MPSANSVILLKALSRLLGWIYTLSWSLSFYPQPLLNLRRHSTTGTTPAFPTLNVLGFLAYTLSTTLFHASPLIKSQYRARHNGEENTVRGNDVAFAVHALLLSLVTWSMFLPRLWGFERNRFRVGRGVWGVVVGCVVGVGVVVGRVWVAGRPWEEKAGGWAWIDAVYAVGYVKLLVTVVKYIPQAWANYQRKSTVGWSIDQILMDMLGGVLSIAQLVIDSSLQKDWSGLVGNPVKFGLGNVSILFDVIFMTQHYILYKGSGKAVGNESEAERRYLLRRDEEEGNIG